MDKTIIQMINIILDMIFITSLVFIFCIPFIYLIQIPKRDLLLYAFICGFILGIAYKKGIGKKLENKLREFLEWYYLNQNQQRFI